MSEIIEKRPHFIRQLIEQDLASGKRNNIVTRFPPEPNGYLHIGHAKSICLNFDMANEFGGKCYLRFDDTNPMKEEEKFVHAIQDDVRWLGFEWCDLTYSSDYYDRLYQYALELIKKGLAYVDSQSMDDIRHNRGTLTEPGQNSPYRNRCVDENLNLFEQMRAGEFNEGTHVLRAKIDMSSANLNMRDPVIYRIRFAHHQRTGDQWCIYPMYDFAHPLSDAEEYITHSLCTLEFQDHRPLYDWFITHCSVPSKPVQTEFSRLNLSHTVTSKRKLRKLVEDNYVDGWDDPRMPTLCGMRKRGFPPKAVHQFCELVGISKTDSVIDVGILEACVRDELNETSKRAFCVMDPIKVVITNYPQDQVESIQATYYPQNDKDEGRTIPFTRELYIERSDFMEEPPKKYFRLSPGKEVRLRHAYVIRCDEVIKNEQGEITELHCSYDVDTLGKNPSDRKVKGVIHWLSVAHAHAIKVIEYDRLFMDANPGRVDDFTQFINEASVQVKNAYVEPDLRSWQEGDICQFERIGYYCVNETKDNQVTAFHRIVNLRDSWGKLLKD